MELQSKPVHTCTYKKSISVGIPSGLCRSYEDYESITQKYESINK